MPVSDTERIDALELVVLMFDAAPGSLYLPLILAEFDLHGHDYAQLAGLLGGSDAFDIAHPVFQTAEEFASSFLVTLGLQQDAFAHDWVVAQYDAGSSPVDIIFDAWQLLQSVVPGVGMAYEDAATTMHNKALVADYYSGPYGGPSDSLFRMHDAIADVTADPASVAAAIDELASGTQALTIGVAPALPGDPMIS